MASAADFSQRSNPDYLVYALEQRHAHGQHALAADISAELDKLLWADLLILNFPLFWCSVPARLKVWIARVLRAGLCCGGLRFYDRGRVAGSRGLLSFSLGGQAHMFADEDAVHGDLHDMLLPLQRGTLAYTGLSVLPPFAAYHVPYVSAGTREAILEQYRDYLDSLDELQPLSFPTLSRFDRHLHPLSNKKQVPA